jgi:hypothetical protein
MQEKALAAGASSTEAQSAAPQGAGAEVAFSSSASANELSDAMKLVPPPEPAGESTSSTNSAASAAPSTGDASQAASAGAAAQRRFFDFRSALRATMNALTKELSLRPTPTPECEASHVSAEQCEATSEEHSARRRPIGLSGHTSTVAIPEVLGFLAQCRKSGTLWIWNEHDDYRVQLVGGNVTFARSEAPRQGSLLGEILIAQGAVDATRFMEFMAQKREPGPLGDALIAAGLVTKEALRAAVQHQAQCVFDRAFGMEDAYFRFDADEGIDTSEGIRISVTKMLLETARERDESERRLARSSIDQRVA